MLDDKIRFYIWERTHRGDAVSAPRLTGLNKEIQLEIALDSRQLLEIIPATGISM